MNNNNNFSPELLSQLSAALMAHMRGAMPLVQHSQTATPQTKSLQKLSQDLLHQLKSPPPRSQASPITPDNGEDLRRSSSLSSISSASSLSSAAHGDDGDDGDNGDNRVRKRARTSQELREYGNIVRGPILRLLDAPFLTPHPALDNPMFRDRPYRGRMTVCKRYKLLNTPFFKTNTGATIRQLTHNHLPRLQITEPTLTYAELRRRLY